MEQKIAIVGGGITGLTASFYLAKAGYQVSIFEKDSELGGLAKGFKKTNWQWSLENFYHHLFTNDDKALKLITKLNLNKKILVLSPKSSILFKNTINRFDSAISLLRYPYLSLPDKIRTALITGYLKITNNWLALEKIPAKDWLVKYYGQNSFEILWEPLLKAKFSDNWKQISMAWFWARIKKRTTNLIYLEGGFNLLVEKLAEEIKKNQGQIYLNQPITNLNDLTKKGFKKILITTPASQFLKINQPKMLGSLVLILSLKKQLLTDNTYWLNINDPGFPFLAVVEHTNFIDKKYYSGQHLVYIGGYYPQDHQYFKMTKQQIYDEFLPYLKKINPSYNFSLLTFHFELFSDLNAQPVIPTNYSRNLSSFKTKIPGVYIANLSMVYPWDRGINYAIELGEKAADEILNS